MSTQYKRGVTTDPAKIAQVYGLCASEWGGGLSAEQLGGLERGRFERNVANGRLHLGFYYQHEETGEILALTFVVEIPGFYKHGQVSPMTVLLISNVFTHADWRGKGLASALVSYAIGYTEDTLRERAAQHGDDTSAAGMAERYIWYLNSGVAEWYKRFGFKAYPQQAYRIPYAVVSEQEGEVFAGALANGSDKLRFWTFDDEDEIKQVLARQQELQLAQLAAGEDNVFMIGSDYLTMKGWLAIAQEQSKLVWSEDSHRYHNYQGAVSNGYYVLWATQKYHAVFILLMGAVDGGLGPIPVDDAVRLVKAACYIGSKRQLQSSLLVHDDELHTDISQLVAGLEASGALVEHIGVEDYKKQILPMLRKFGSTAPDVDVEWKFPSRLTWG